MALTTGSTFEAKVLRGMREEKLQVRRILRVFAPIDTGWPSEVLFVAMDGRPGTVWVDPCGKVVRGPVAGFGDPFDL